MRTTTWASLALSTLLSGCATMYVHGNRLSTTIEADGRKTTLRVLNFDHATSDLRIFEDGREIELMAVPDHIIASNIRQWQAQMDAEMEARDRCHIGSCEYSWTVPSRIMGPGLWLDKDRPHTLTFVRGGQQATVTVKRSFKVGWVFANWVWFSFAPIGWIVDGAKGSWNMYSRLDIDQVFQRYGRPLAMR